MCTIMAIRELKKKQVALQLSGLLHAVVIPRKVSFDGEYLATPVTGVAGKLEPVELLSRV